MCYVRTCGKQISADAADGPCQRQDDTCCHHGVYSRIDAFEKVAECQDFSKHKVDEGEDQRNQRTQCQCSSGVGVSERIKKAHLFFAPVSAYIQHGQDAGYDQEQDRYDQVADLAFGVFQLFQKFFFCGALFQFSFVDPFSCSHFCLEHRAEVSVFTDRHVEYHEDGQDGVQVHRDG